MARILGTWPDGSPEWHAARQGRIGGSEIAAVCGWSQFETRADLLDRKAGVAEPRKESKAMRRGTALEPALLSWLADDKGLIYDPDRSNATWQHDQHDWAVYNPDAVTTTGVLVEAKTTSDRTTERGWGRAGTDQIPLGYAAQVTWGMGILGLTDALLVVLAGGINGRPSLDFAVYKIRFDPDVFTYLLDQGQQFITDLNHHTTTPGVAA